VRKAALFLLLATLPGLTGAQESPEPLQPGKKGVTYPQLLDAPLPSYPQTASRAGIHGSVLLSYVVLASGKVDQITVVESTADFTSEPEPSAKSLAGARADFEGAARRALGHRRYAPAMQKARPVPVSMQVRFYFSPEERLSLHRWNQVEAGLRALATANLIPPDANVAGEKDVSFPAAIKQKKPVQPHAARLRAIQSRVLLLLLVDSDGQVADVPLARAEVTDYPFAEAAETAVRQWQFSPAEKEGVPVSAYHWLRLTIPADHSGR